MTLLPARALLSVALVASFTEGCASRTASTPKPSPAPASTGTAMEVERDAADPSIERLLQGRASGVTVERTADGGIAVRIRGTSSFYGSNEPLYVIDDVPINAGPRGILKGINPHDIESIQVLKNPADVAIYGIRGANGVVVIKTKRPRR